MNLQCWITLFDCSFCPEKCHFHLHPRHNPEFMSNAALSRAALSAQGYLQGNLALPDFDLLKAQRSMKMECDWKESTDFYCDLASQPEERGMAEESLRCWCRG